MAYAGYYKPELHGADTRAAEAGWLTSMLAKFRHWRLRGETRRQLRNLPDYVLEDIGITRYQIENDEIRF